MSRFFSQKYTTLTPYTPGEQPRDQKYIKLNTNESPFPPSPLAQRLARQAAGDLQLYSDPTCADLVAIAAETLGVPQDCLLFTNGSDEILDLAFMAFCDAQHPAVFADVTYGFYPVFARRSGIPYREIPLREDFSLAPEDYDHAGGTIFIANPNAPTGLCLPVDAVEEIVKSNPDNLVVIDEAYVDFGGQSALPLIQKYDNLLVCQTFSKSRSLAGARLGFGAGCPALIRDLNTLKYAINPYNVNRMTMAAGIGTLQDAAYFKTNCERIIATREATAAALKKMGFTLTDSRTNFLWASHPALPGDTLYRKLKAKGILIRHFTAPRLRDHNRITVGSEEEMAALLTAVKEILEETV